MELTGYIEVSNPLFGTAIDSSDVLDFSFSDGRQTLSMSNTGSVDAFFVSFDSSGDISSWSIELANVANIFGIGSPYNAIRTSPSFIQNIIGVCTALNMSNQCISLSADQALEGGVPSGSWAIGSAPATTPLPSAFPLFATGLGAMGLLGWRRKRKAQAVA